MTMSGAEAYSVPTATGEEKPQHSEEYLKMQAYFASKAGSTAARETVTGKAQKAVTNPPDERKLSLVPDISSVIPEMVIDPTDPLAWKLGAPCSQTDPEEFFPEKGGTTRQAKRICELCDVAKRCLDYALENDERFGIWGGHSERERRPLRINPV